MATYTYTNTVPNANNAPKNDQPDMLQNTQSTSGLISEDHISFNIANGGYHKIIHQMASGTAGQSQNFARSGAGATYSNTPATIAGINQVLTGLYTPDATVTTAKTQLFNVNGSGDVSQLTGNLLTNTATSDGWCWVGGILLQWGFISSTAQAASNILTFKDRVAGAIPFPNNCFYVTTSLCFKNAVTTSNIRTAQCGVRGPTVSVTGFEWVYSVDTSGIMQGLYWFAIGN